MKALVFLGPNELAVEERPDPEVAGGEVLLRIVATGICGSDLHGYTGENGRRHPGQVMGHETVAEVAVDPSGTLTVGQVVTVNPVIGCGNCEACAVGATQRCARRRVIGVNREISSAFAELMTAPLGNIVPLAPGVPPEIGGLVEPLAVGFHAARRAGVETQDRVLVIGGGPIGQAAALASRRLGATRVLVSEPDAGRRALVETLEFATVDPATTDSKGIVTALDGPATIVLDAVGTTGTVRTSLEASGFGARIVLVGMNAPELSLPAYLVSTEERSIIGSFCYDAAEFADTAKWAGEHVAELTPLIDARVPLHDGPRAFAQLASGELRASKVLVYLDGSLEAAR
jgi:threonine dehydrogenase-like Zn-dependent dehydrogenase